jgi:sulfofructose kinase
MSLTDWDMSQSTKPLLLALGYANADVLARVPHLPGDGDRVTAGEIAVYPGGMAANCACAAALLGSRVFYFGNIGHDPLGSLLLEDFKHYGVNTLWATRIGRTTTAIVTVTPQGERSIISEPTDYHPESLAAFLKEQQEPQGFLYLDGYHLGCAEAEVEFAKSKGYTIYCDLDGAPDTYRRPEILNALAVVDIVQWNPKVAAEIFPDQDSEDVDLKLAELVDTVITTRGAESVHVLHKGQRITIPVPTTDEVVDTTGAGDIFAGVFLHAYTQRESVESAARAAVEVASKSTCYHGARLPLEAIKLLQGA